MDGTLSVKIASQGKSGLRPVQYIASQWTILEILKLKYYKTINRELRFFVAFAITKTFYV